MSESHAEQRQTLRNLRPEGASAHLGLNRLKLQIEAILFAAETPLDLGEIRQILGDTISNAEVRVAIKELTLDYNNRAFFMFEIGNKFQLRTRPEFASLLQKQFASKPRSLSKAALETLAIVAYRQPVTRAEILAIRGVDSASILTSLIEKELVVAAGKRREVGQPFEYRTTQKFLDVFGITKLSELPSLRSLQMSQNEQVQVTQALSDIQNLELTTETLEDAEAKKSIEDNM